ncbi:hypothetical protein E4U59_006958 [Claviceps monticola]|nr:hypothetical protein E4U59_006958 [Claviceps monticola]
MAPSTRVSSKSTETPDPQSNTNQEVPFNTGDSSNSATTSTDGLADLERQLAMAQLRAKIAQANSQRRAFEKENAADEQGAAIPSATLTGTVGTIGERLTPPFFITIAKELVGVSAEDVNDIYTGKFEPWSLIRLHPSRGARPSRDEPTSSIDISATGILTVKKRNHSQSECGSNPLVYMHAFLNYTYIYGRLFGAQHPDVVSAMNRFAAFILDKSEHYSWKKCLEYAMKHHLSVKANTIHCAASWLDHPRASSQKRQRSDTTTAIVCRDFNAPKGCTDRACTDSHECAACGNKDHARPACRQTQDNTGGFSPLEGAPWPASFDSPEVAHIRAHQRRWLFVMPCAPKTASQPPKQTNNNIGV